MENTIKAIVGGISYIKYYRNSLAKALLVPFILLALITSLAFLPDVGSKGVFAINLLQWIPLTLIAVTTHRIILEGPDSVPTWGINRFGAREFKFIGYQFLVAIAALPAAVFTFIPYIGIFLSLVAIAYIIGRLSLVLPSIAIDSNIGLKQSWEATKNHQTMMVVVVILSPILFGFIERFLATLPGLFWISVVISLLTTVFLIAMLSVAYKIVMEPKLAR